jgi:hypothetical protein
VTPKPPGVRVSRSYLHIVECDNAIEIEKILLDVFNERFTLFAGREYFKGDENEMRDVFYNVYKNNKKNKNTETTNKIQESVYQEKCDKQYDCDDEECDEEECDEEECDEEECQELTDKDNESIKEIKTKKNTEYKYTCDKCNYKTNKTFLWKQHLDTIKHKNDESIINDMNKYMCKCGKKFNFRQGLHKHKKICKKLKSLTEEEEKNKTVDFKELILTLINQNKELQDLLIKQQEETNKKYENLVLQIK